MSISHDPSIFYSSETALGWGAEDISARFGNISLTRIVLDPVPGTATEEDLIRIHDQTDRICELVDGTIVEKAMGRYESYLMFVLSGYFHDYLKINPVGYVVGESG